MRYFLLLSIFFWSCSSSPESPSVLRKDFSPEEQEVIHLSKDIIKNAYFGTFITVDSDGQPRARVMEPFAPDDDFVIWLATNPRSRKVNQLKAHPKVTLHYFDKDNLGYVSLMGEAVLVNNKATKAAKWKDGWENFYPNKDKDYLLIKFIPKTLELISIPNKFTGDSVTWKPHQIRLRKTR